LIEKGEPVLGVVHDVVRGWSYAGARGRGATLNGQAISAPVTDMGDSSLLMLTSNLLINNKLPGWAPHWLSQTNWKVRVLGSAALEACQVAAGLAHAAVTVNGKLWDIAAPAAIVLEAGGAITDLAGNPIFPFDLRNYTGARVPFVAAGKAALPTILREIREHP
jgi:myo-inositol-1(or 4)-monophosphatase